MANRISYGDDSPPLMWKVQEPPPSHWGKLTSQGKTASQQYQEFLTRARDADRLRLQERRGKR